MSGRRRRAIIQTRKKGKEKRFRLSGCCALHELVHHWKLRLYPPFKTFPSPIFILFYFILFYFILFIFLAAEKNWRWRRSYLFLFISSHWSAKRLLTSCQPSFGIADNLHFKKKLGLSSTWKNSSRLKNDINKLGRVVETLGVIQDLKRRKRGKHINFCFNSPGRLTNRESFRNSCEESVTIGFCRTDDGTLLRWNFVFLSFFFRLWVLGFS